MLIENLVKILIDKKELIEALPLAKEYTEIKIPKRRAGFRTLLIPSPELKKIQRKILRLLKRTFKTNYGGVYGLRRGSYVDHAERHSNSRLLFLFDLKDAFSSVDISQLWDILYSQFNIRQRMEYSNAEELTNLIIKLTTFERNLPQGAPTSPFLFELAITKTGLYEKLWSFCPAGWRISCYCDNFVISGQKPLPPEIKQEIFKCIERFGFKANKKKTREFDCRQGSPLICGVRVNGMEGRVSLPKKTIRKWRGIIHQASFSPNDLKLKEKVEGFINSLWPIYREELPAQISKPYQRYEKVLEAAKAIEAAKNKQPTGQTNLDRWAFLFVRRF